MNVAANNLRADEASVRAEDLAQLSWFGFDHIHLLERYAFILPNQIARGEFRLLDTRNTSDESCIEPSVPLL